MKREVDRLDVYIGTLRFFRPRQSCVKDHYEHSVEGGRNKTAKFMIATRIWHLLITFEQMHVPNLLSEVLCVNSFHRAQKTVFPNGSTGKHGYDHGFPNRQRPSLCNAAVSNASNAK